VKPESLKGLMMNSSRLIISVKEARKILGKDYIIYTDGELENMIIHEEQLIRFVIKQYMVHKSTMV
jgi:hypothetical protein